MKRTIFTGVLLLTAGLSGLLAQQAPPATSKGPQPKSKGEQDAIVALQSAVDPDGMIKAAEDLMTKFADTDYKEFALSMEAHAYHQKRDDVNALVFGERVLQMNPKNFQTQLLVAEVITQGIKDHDLDRAEKLTKATQLFTDGIENIKTATKPNPALPDADWAAGKKYATAEANNGLGMLAQIDKKWDEAIKQYQLALDGDPEQDAYATRLASAYLAAGKIAECTALCDKLLAKPNLHPQIKAAVNSIKASAAAKK